MQAEQKECRQCKNKFPIDEEHFAHLFKKDADGSVRKGSRTLYYNCSVANAETGETCYAIAKKTLETSRKQGVETKKAAKLASAEPPSADHVDKYSTASTLRTIANTGISDIQTRSRDLSQEGRTDVPDKQIGAVVLVWKKSPSGAPFEMCVVLSVCLFGRITAPLSLCLGVILEPVLSLQPTLMSKSTRSFFINCSVTRLREEVNHSSTPSRKEFLLRTSARLQLSRCSWHSGLNQRKALAPLLSHALSTLCRVRGLFSLTQLLCMRLAMVAVVLLPRPHTCHLNKIYQSCLELLLQQVPPLLIFSTLSPLEFYQHRNPQLLRCHSFCRHWMPL